jgi:hypothetical protein
VASEILPCWRCGKVPTVDPNGGYPVIACDDCYSGPPDFCASGLNAAQAISEWNERAEQEEEDRRCTEGDCKNRGQFDGRCYFHRAAEPIMRLAASLAKGWV